MRKQFALAFSVLMLWGAGPARAVINCLVPLKNVMADGASLPQPIPETKRASEYPNAVNAYGTILKAGERIPAEQRQDGFYIYVVAQAKGQSYVLWGLRAPGEIEPGKNLVTHNALIEQLSRKLGSRPSAVTVRGAGQSQILYGKVSTLDNKSGSRRGGPAHLNYAEAVLAEAGLPILPATVRTEFSKMEEGEEDIHADADDQARIVAEVRANPRLRELAKQLAQRHKQMYDEFPELHDPETPGYLDKDKILARAEVDPQRSKLTPAEAGNLAMYRIALRYVQRDGPEFAAYNQREMNEAELLKWIDWGIQQHRANRTPR